MKYTIHLAKEYHNHETGQSRTIEGTIVVKAGSYNEAVQKVQSMIENGLQTIDKRITWDEDFLDLFDLGYEYIDFTFGIMETVNEK